VRPPRRFLMGLAVFCALAVLPTTPTSATTHPKSWDTIKETYAAALDPTSTNPCTRGSVECIDAVVREMRRRERALAIKCDHSVMFAYTYRATTNSFRVGWPRDFASPAYMAHLDGAFAMYYFDAYDAWKKGDRGVSDAWQTAFDAAASNSVSGLGDMLLGINAHISRDLPFVLEEIGLTRPDGTSALDDYNLANQILVDTQGGALGGAARRFDPDVANVSIPGLFVGKDGFLALYRAWRAESWSRAEQLVSAASPEARQSIADQIEVVAQSRALAIATATAYVPFLSSTAAREKFCRAHGS
jgi:hypothetical protein